MDGFSILNAPVLDAESVKQTPDYQAGHALGWLYRGNKQAATQHPLAGRLHIAQSGWLLLSVPNALVRGVYDALTAPGTELPLAGTLNVPNVKPDVLNAHISVMTAEEVDRIGADKISERGHMFRYALGPLQEIPVHNVEGVSKIWAIQVAAPELAALRKSYGLAPYPKNHPFHITVAVRRKGVLQDNNVSKFDAPSSRGELKAAAAKQANDPIDFDQWHGKAFKIVTTPPGMSVKSHTDGTPIADEPGRVSIVTPENGDSWNWPDAPAETVSNFKKNWGSIQGGIGGYKMDQIRRGMQSQQPAKQQNTPPPRPVHTSSSAPITAPKTASAADETTYDCGCSGKCMCPPTCVCKRYCGCATKSANDAPWATFVVAPHAKGYAATTRPTGDGKFGLPGGKLEPGEDPLAAAAREASEEGWDVTDLHPEPLHKADVDGKPVWWYRAGGAKQRDEFKEKGRVLPTVAKAKQLTEFGNDVALKAYRAAMRPPRPDLTKLAPKWSERDHLLAALPKHLDDTRAALGAQGDVDKEMTDLALIAQAWLKSQKQKELLAARLKKFQETAAYPSLAAPKMAAAGQPQPRVRVVLPYKNKYLLETLNNSKWPQNIGKRRFIGGGIEAGETPEQAAAREMFEELGVKIKPTAFRPLGHDPRDGWQHEQYLELLKHKLKPGNFNATVGSDAVVTLSHGLPEGADYMGPDLKKLLAPALKAAADKLPGGEADGVPDSKFPPKVLAEGADHEHEHTDDDQIAKEIAKDHLSEDPRYYEKQKEVEKGAEHSGLLRELQQAKAHSDAKRYAHKHEILRRLMAQAPQDWEVDDDKPKYKGVTHKPTKFRFHTAPITIPPSVKKAMQDGGAAPGYQTPQQAPSVYWGQLKNLATMRQPLRYDYNKTVFDNVRDHLQAVKQRGDFMLQANRNYEQYRAAVDPMYRQELARRAVMGDMPQQNWFDQSVQMYGDHTLNAIFGTPK